MKDEADQLMFETLAARRALVREARIKGYLEAAEDLEAMGPEAVRTQAQLLRDGYSYDDS